MNAKNRKDLSYDEKKDFRCDIIAIYHIHEFEHADRLHYHAAGADLCGAGDGSGGALCDLLGPDRGHASRAEPGRGCAGVHGETDADLCPLFPEQGQRVRGVLRREMDLVLGSGSAEGGSGRSWGADGPVRADGFYAAGTGMAAVRLRAVSRPLSGVRALVLRRSCGYYGSLAGNEKHALYCEYGGDHASGTFSGEISGYSVSAAAGNFRGLPGDRGGGLPHPSTGQGEG